MVIKSGVVSSNFCVATKVGRPGTELGDLCPWPKPNTATGNTVRGCVSVPGGLSF